MTRLSTTLFLSACAALLTSQAEAAKDYGDYLVDKATILFVYDGDTFFINDPSCPPVFCERLGVRLRGIDTPEKRGKCEGEIAKAKVGQRYLEQAIAGSTQIELRHIGREKYGRLLGDLFVDGRDVAAELIAEGLAVPYFGKTKTKDWCKGRDHEDPSLTTRQEPYPQAEDHPEQPQE